MGQAVFDALEYMTKLERVSFTREQAETQAAALRAVIDERIVIRDYRDARLKETQLQLEKQIQEAKYGLLKWQFGLAVAICLIMAKGFGWLGF